MTDRLSDLPAEPARDASSEEVENFLEEILFHYLLGREEGVAVEVDAYLARYPRQAEAIARLMVGYENAPLVEDEPDTTTRAARRRWSLERLGGYRVQTLAASTARGHVYRSVDEETGAEVALKVLRRIEHMDPRELERFLREAKTLARLEIPGVVPVLDVGEDEGSVYYAMQWVDGQTVGEVVAALRGDGELRGLDPETFDLAARVRLFAGFARILHQVHENGVLHRDIKPSNLMIGPGGEPMVVDFGVARDFEDSGLTRTSDPPLGTPLYLAPELITGVNPADVRSEIFSLASTLWELITLSAHRRHGDRAEFYADVEKPAPDLKKALPGAPPALARVFRRALAISPASRPADMATFADELEAALEARPGLWARLRRGLFGG